MSIFVKIRVMHVMSSMSVVLGIRHLEFHPIVMLITFIEGARYECRGLLSRMDNVRFVVFELWMMHHLLVVEVLHSMLMSMSIETMNKSSLSSVHRVVREVNGQNAAIMNELSGGVEVVMVRLTHEVKFLSQLAHLLESG